jgi:excinuclease ABC subunit A
VHTQRAGKAKDDPQVLDVAADRFRVQSADASRVMEAIEVALQRGSGRMTAYRMAADADTESKGEAFGFSTGLHCPASDVRYSDPTPSMFSFNSPAGACPKCKGFGRVIGVDYGLVIPNDKLTLRAGVIKTISGCRSIKIRNSSSYLSKICKCYYKLFRRKNKKNFCFN